jgi:hypothetical protein
LFVQAQRKIRSLKRKKTEAEYYRSLLNSLRSRWYLKPFIPGSKLGPHKDFPRAGVIAVHDLTVRPLLAVLRVAGDRDHPYSLAFSRRRKCAPEDRAIRPRNLQRSTNCRAGTALISDKSPTRILASLGKWLALRQNDWLQARFVKISRCCRQSLQNGYQGTASRKLLA